MNNPLKMITRNRPVCTGAGLVTLDVIFDGDPKSPKFFAGGSCGNVLTILSYLGWRSFPIVRLGKDIEGRRIIQDMENWGVNTKFIEKDPNIASPRIIEKIYSGKNPRHTFSFKCKHGKWLPDRKVFLLDSLKQIENKIPASKVFYFDRATPSSLLMAKHQKENGTLIVFEPPRFLSDKTFKECLKTADIVKHCYGAMGSESPSEISSPLEIQTMGEEGLRYRANVLGKKKWKTLPSFTVGTLVDAAGSGDWLTAGLIHILGQNGVKGKITESKLELALRTGQCLAALNCYYNGARGMMYHLSKTRLQNIVHKVLCSDKNTAEDMLPDTKPIVIKSDLSAKCKICLCQ